MGRLNYLLVTAVVTFGIFVGLACYTFIYANGFAYLTDSPEACANCHVMRNQYDGWLKSSHRNAATCNSCHTPEALIPKYAVKAINGFNHSMAFTLQNFHEPIRINRMNLAVTEGACRTCHETVVHAIDANQGANKEPLSCTSCHRDVGHKTHK